MDIETYNEIIMLYDLTKRLMPYTILIALVGFVMAWAFSLNNAYMTTITVAGTELKYFDWSKYVQQISNAWDTAPLQFELLKPTKQWDDTGTWYNWEPMFNNLGYMLNWAYFPINVILWVVRWIAWLFNLLLTILGWDTTRILVQDPINPINWKLEYNSYTMRFLQWITENLMIPYIQ